MRRSALIACLTLLVTGLCGAAEKPAGAAISWRVFEPASFQKAKEEGKLVLLWIEAPWGHWDRIMKELTFADPAVVSLVNEKFVPIRVDTLERPDIYARYGMGGWPTTAFLLHTGQPFFFPDASRRIVKAGGTYYSAEALGSFLKELADYYGKNREAAEKTADEIAQKIIERKEVDSAPLTPEIVEVAVTKVLEAYAALDADPDPNRRTPRYPDADSSELAFSYYVRKGNREVLDVMLRILVGMARGGIRDQIGGGFHRFAVDAAWRVPAFEKLLTVNAEMLQAYGDVYKLSNHGRYLEVTEEIARYVLSTLKDPDGWFYAYQAADARLGEDGDYYTWTLEEAREVLSDEEEKLVLPSFDIAEWGDLVNSAPRRNVLFVLEGPTMLAQRLEMEEAKIQEVLDAAVAKLLEARGRRQAPPVGKILVTDANAAMAASLVQTGDHLGRPELREAGLRALDFVWDNARDPNSGLMDHVWRPGAGRAGLDRLFSDQAQTARALLIAAESTGETRWLERARQLIEKADATFSDSLNGGWMDVRYSADAPGLLSWPSRSIRDNAIFAESLIRLRHLSGRKEDDRLLDLARKALGSWADEFAGFKELSASYALAVDRLLSHPVEILVVGEPADPGFEQVLAQARGLYHPWKIIRRVGPAQADRELAGRQVTPPKEPAAVLCLESRCAGPYTAQEKLRPRLEEFLNATAPAPAGRKPAAAEEGR